MMMKSLDYSSLTTRIHEIDANKEVGQFTQEEPQQEDQEVEEEEV